MTAKPNLGGSLLVLAVALVLGTVGGGASVRSGRNTGAATLTVKEAHRS